MIKKIIATSIFCFTAWQALEAQPDHEYIRGKLVIYYYSNPNGQSATPYPRISDTVVRNFAAGTSTLFGGSSGMRGMESLFGALLRPVSQGGDAQLQSFVKRILQIRNRRIGMFIFNDSLSLNANARRLNGCEQTERNRSGDSLRTYYWPCATNTNEGTGESFSGIVYLGRRFFELNNSNPAYGKAVFMHEFFHTQDLSDPSFHKYFVGGNYYHYGADGSHFYQEVIPSVGMAYKEGIANSLMFLFSNNFRNQYLRWFDTNDYLIVEQNMPPASTAAGISRDVWLYSLLTNERAPLSASPYAGYSQIRIRDLPLKYILYNELIIALICSKYIDLISMNRFMSSVAVRNSITNSRSDFGELVNVLCELGLPEGLTMADFGRSTPVVDSVSERNLYLIPLAYCDYFTGWRARDANQFAAILNNKVNRDLLNFYWNNFHDELRRRFPLPTTYSTGRGSTYDNMVEIAMRFGVRTSDPRR